MGLSEEVTFKLKPKGFKEAVGVKGGPGWEGATPQAGGIAGARS